MITRKELSEETRRIKLLKKQGWSERDIKSWLRGWRAVGAKK